MVSYLLSQVPEPREREDENLWGQESTIQELNFPTYNCHASNPYIISRSLHALGAGDRDQTLRDSRRQAGLQAEFRRVLGLDGLELLQEAEEHERDLRERKLLANAYPRPAAERGILPPKPGGFWSVCCP